MSRLPSDPSRIVITRWPRLLPLQSSDISRQSVGFGNLSPFYIVAEPASSLLFGCGDPGASRPSFRLAHVSGSFPNSASGCAGFWRCSSRLRTSQKSFTAGIRLRSACRNFHRHFCLLHEYLAGAIVVLMLSGGEALENYALRNASSVLRALAKRMPAIAHRKRDSVITDVALDDIAVGDTLVVYPHDICPVDGTVIEATAS